MKLSILGFPAALVISAQTMAFDSSLSNWELQKDAVLNGVIDSGAVIDVLDYTLTHNTFSASGNSFATVMLGQFIDATTESKTSLVSFKEVKDDDVVLYTGHDSGNGVYVGTWYSTDGQSGDFTFKVNSSSGTVVTPIEGAHQYWRLVNLQIPSGGYFEVSELEIYDSSSNGLSSAAAITSSKSPAYAGLTSLFDGNTNNRAYWTESVAEGSDFFIQWDFGDGITRKVDFLRQAGFDKYHRYIDSFTLQYSDDGVNWTDQSSQTGLTYPGDYTWSEYYDVAN